MRFDCLPCDLHRRQNIYKREVHIHNQNQGITSGMSRNSTLDTGDEH